MSRSKPKPLLKSLLINNDGFDVDKVDFRNMKDHVVEISDCDSFVEWWTGQEFLYWENIFYENLYHTHKKFSYDTVAPVEVFKPLLDDKVYQKSLLAVVGGESKKFVRCLGVVAHADRPVEIDRVKQMWTCHEAAVKFNDVEQLPLFTGYNAENNSIYCVRFVQESNFVYMSNFSAQMLTPILYTTIAPSVIADITAFLNKVSKEYSVKYLCVDDLELLWSAKLEKWYYASRFAYSSIRLKKEDADPENYFPRWNSCADAVQYLKFRAESEGKKEKVKLPGILITTHEHPQSNYDDSYDESDSDWEMDVVPTDNTVTEKPVLVTEEHSMLAFGQFLLELLTGMTFQDVFVCDGNGIDQDAISELMEEENDDTPYPEVLLACKIITLSAQNVLRKNKENKDKRSLVWTILRHIAFNRPQGRLYAAVSLFTGRYTGQFTHDDKMEQFMRVTYWWYKLLSICMTKLDPIVLENHLSAVKHLPLRPMELGIKRTRINSICELRLLFEYAHRWKQGCVAANAFIGSTSLPTEYEELVRVYMEAEGNLGLYTPPQCVLNGDTLLKRTLSSEENEVATNFIDILNSIKQRFEHPSGGVIVSENVIKEISNLSALIKSKSSAILCFSSFIDKTFGTTNKKKDNKAEADVSNVEYVLQIVSSPIFQKDDFQDYGTRYERKKEICDVERALSVLYEDCMSSAIRIPFEFLMAGVTAKHGLVIITLKRMEKLGVDVATDWNDIPLLNDPCGWWERVYTFTMHATREDRSPMNTSRLLPSTVVMGSYLEHRITREQLSDVLKWKNAVWSKLGVDSTPDENLLRYYSKQDNVANADVVDDVLIHLEEIEKSHGTELADKLFGLMDYEGMTRRTILFYWYQSKRKHRLIHWARVVWFIFLGCDILSTEMCVIFRKADRTAEARWVEVNKMLEGHVTTAFIDMFRITYVMFGDLKFTQPNAKKYYYERLKQVIEALVCDDHSKLRIGIINGPEYWKNKDKIHESRSVSYIHHAAMSLAPGKKANRKIEDSNERERDIRSKSLKDIHNLLCRILVYCIFERGRRLNATMDEITQHIADYYMIEGMALKKNQHKTMSDRRIALSREEGAHELVYRMEKLIKSYDNVRYSVFAVEELGVGQNRFEVIQRVNEPFQLLCKSITWLKDLSVDIVHPRHDVITHKGTIDKDVIIALGSAQFKQRKCFNYNNSCRVRVIMEMVTGDEGDIAESYDVICFEIIHRDIPGTATLGKGQKRIHSAYIDCFEVVIQQYFNSAMSLAPSMVGYGWGFKDKKRISTYAIDKNQNNCVFLIMSNVVLASNPLKRLSRPPILDSKWRHYLAMVIHSVNRSDCTRREVLNPEIFEPGARMSRGMFLLPFGGINQKMRWNRIRVLPGVGHKDFAELPALDSQNYGLDPIAIHMKWQVKRPPIVKTDVPSLAIFEKSAAYHMDELTSRDSSRAFRGIDMLSAIFYLVFHFQIFDPRYSTAMVAGLNKLGGYNEKKVSSFYEKHQALLDKGCSSKTETRAFTTYCKYFGDIGGFFPTEKGQWSAQFVDDLVKRLMEMLDVAVGFSHPDQVEIEKLRADSSHKPKFPLYQIHRWSSADINTICQHHVCASDTDSCKIVDALDNRLDLMSSRKSVSCVTDNGVKLSPRLMGVNQPLVKFYELLSMNVEQMFHIAAYYMTEQDQKAISKVSSFTDQLPSQFVSELSGLRTGGEVTVAKSIQRGMKHLKANGWKITAAEYASGPAKAAYAEQTVGGIAGKISAALSNFRTTSVNTTSTSRRQSTAGK